MEPIRELTTSTYVRTIKSKSKSGDDIDVLDSCGAGDTGAVKLDLEQLKETEVFLRPVMLVNIWFVFCVYFCLFDCTRINKAIHAFDVFSQIFRHI